MSLESMDSILAGCAGADVVFVTGAGLSAASGIPTFRGEEGYWTAGSVEYRPEEMATHAAFDAMPKEVWRWYLYRRGVCRRAEPNRGHRVLSELESRLGERFHLVTQNVDGLHLRAGNSLERTFQIHGNIDFMRCTAGCSEPPQPMDESLQLADKSAALEDEMWEALRCASCGTLARPHVLWFDECYDEVLYRASSSLRAAESAGLVVTVGTSGATNLPHQIVRTALQGGASLIDINPAPNPFSELAERHGAWLREASDESLPALAKGLR